MSAVLVATPALAKLAGATVVGPEPANVVDPVPVEESMDLETRRALAEEIGNDEELVALADEARELRSLYRVEQYLGENYPEVLPEFLRAVERRDQDPRFNASELEAVGLDGTEFVAAAVNGCDSINRCEYTFGIECLVYFCGTCNFTSGLCRGSSYEKKAAASRY